jgi:hypothetical protein
MLCIYETWHYSEADYSQFRPVIAALRSVERRTLIGARRMHDKLPPDFKCPCCPNEFEVMPRYVLKCDICECRSCGFDCLKAHRTKCFPTMTDYPRKYKNQVMKLW